MSTFTAAVMGGAIGLVSALSVPATEPSADGDYGHGQYLARCASCHGLRLQGGQHAPPLVGADFRADFAGKPARRLYSRIISTMPMDDPGSLAEPDALAIALYVFAVNQIPLGTPTATRPSDLDGVMIPKAPVEP